MNRTLPLISQLKIQLEKDKVEGFLPPTQRNKGTEVCKEDRAQVRTETITREGKNRLSKELCVSVTFTDEFLEVTLD